jgi:hypothetical protein
METMALAAGMKLESENKKVSENKQVSDPNAKNAALPTGRAA